MHLSSEQITELVTKTVKDPQAFQRQIIASLTLEQAQALLLSFVASAKDPEDELLPLTFFPHRLRRFLTEHKIKTRGQLRDLYVSGGLEGQKGIGSSTIRTVVRYLNQ